MIGFSSLLDCQAVASGPVLGLAVADDARDDQPRVVERGAEGVAEGITKLAAFMDRAGGRRRDVAGNAAGKGEHGEQLFQPGLVLGDVWIDLAPGAFEIDVAYDGRAAMAGSSDVEHV